MNRQSDDASNVSRALAAQTESIQRFVTENIAELHREHAKSAELQSELARTKTELEVRYLLNRMQPFEFF
jgi:regulator of sigma D